MSLDIVRHAPKTASKRATVLFLHGAWSWHWYWEEFFLPYFAEAGFEAVAFSLRGHGKSAGRERLNRFTIVDYAEDLAQVAASLDRPLIVGHSMGGYITQAYLTRHTPRAAVLLCPAAPKPPYKLLLRMMLAQPLRFLGAAFGDKPVAAETDDLALRRKQMFSRGPEDTSMDHYLANLQPESTRAVTAMLTRPLAGTGRVKTPLLLIGAERDKLIRPETIATTAKVYGLAPLMFPGMSHMPMLEPQWRAVADAIIGFSDAHP